MELDNETMDMRGETIEGPSCDPPPPPETNKLHHSQYPYSLLKYMDEIVKLVDLKALVPVLNKHSVITGEESEQLLNPNLTSHDRKRKLTEFMDNKGKKGRNLFLQALLEEKEHIGHQQLYELIVKAQPADPITSYARHLKYQYRKPLPDDDKSLTTPTKYYVELAVISSESISRKEADEFTRKTLHGLTEEVMRKKTPIALENILEPGEDGNPVRCVLVEGAPGAGKSRLAWELCHKWEELECTKHYDLVVLVQLRGKRAQEATCLSDLFPKSEVDMEELLASIGNGKGLLLILDGFDELPCEKQKNNSVYIELIKGVELLPEATIIITSRPSVSACFLKYNIDKHLEVLGFTAEQIEQYGRSVFGNGEDFEAFWKYVNSNPVIKGMMYLPLNAAIVVSIFKDSYCDDCPYPKTITQLYDALTRSLIRRYLVAKEIVSTDYCMPKSLQHKKEINKLPYEVAGKLLFLAKVAYEGLTEGKYVFTDLGSKFDHIGMMKETTSLDVSIGPTSSFSFFHLSLQEYLSAIHISLELHVNLEVPSSFSGGNTIIRFLAGLCKCSNDILCQKMSNLLCDEHGLNSLRVVQCVYECGSIVQKISVLKELFDRKLIHVRGNLPFDYYLIGHCINCIGGRWHVAVSSQEEVDLLRQGLGSYDTCSSGKIQELKLYSNVLPTFEPLFKLCLCDLNCLQLCMIEFTENDASFLYEYINLTRGVLKRIEFQFCDNFMLVLPIVFGPSSLQSLKLNSFFVMTTAIQTLISTNSNLKELTTTIYDKKFLEQLAAALYSNESLILLEIEFLGALITYLPVLIELLQSNHTLQVVRFLAKDLNEPDVEPMVQLVEAAANSTSHKKISCCKKVVDRLQLRITKQYQNIILVHDGEYEATFC